MGVIVTELMIDALTYAFPDHDREGRVIVGYEAHGDDWTLSVSDDGFGKATRTPGSRSSGIGTSLTKALAQQLDAPFEVVTGANGTTACMTCATFKSLLPTAASAGSQVGPERQARHPSSRASRQDVPTDMPASCTLADAHSLISLAHHVPIEAPDEPGRSLAKP